MNEIIKATQSRISNLRKEHGLDLPENYSVGNAMNSAYLKLQQTKDRNKNPVLTVCSKTSIANALLDMAIQGLNPAKDQCYFVAYGKTLTLMRSYLGTVAAAKRMADIKDVVARIIYQDDVFNYEIIRGNIKINKHEQTFQNRKADKAMGAYAVIRFNDSRPDYVEMMDLAEIENAWSQGQIFKKGKSQPNIPHAKFKSEMMKKTVTARACKKYINSSNDNSLYAESFNRADIIQAEEETREQIETEANTEDFDEAIEEEKQAYEKPVNTPDERAASGYGDNREDAEEKEREKKIDAAIEKAQPETPEREEKEKTDNEYFLSAIKEMKGKLTYEEYAELKNKYNVKEAAEILDRKKQVKFYNDLRDKIEFKQY